MCSLVFSDGNNLKKLFIHTHHTLIIHVKILRTTFFFPGLISSNKFGEKFRFHPMNRTHSKWMISASTVTSRDNYLYNLIWYHVLSEWIGQLKQHITHFPIKYCAQNLLQQQRKSKKKKRKGANVVQENHAKNQKLLPKISAKHPKLPLWKLW